MKRKHSKYEDDSEDPVNDVEYFTYSDSLIYSEDSEDLEDVGDDKDDVFKCKWPKNIGEHQLINPNYSQEFVIPNFRKRSAEFIYHVNINNELLGDDHLEDYGEWENLETMRIYFHWLLFSANTERKKDYSGKLVLLLEDEVNYEFIFGLTMHFQYTNTLFYLLQNYNLNSYQEYLKMITKYAMLNHLMKVYKKTISVKVKKEILESQYHLQNLMNEILKLNIPADDPYLKTHTHLYSCTCY